MRGGGEQERGVVGGGGGVEKWAAVILKGCEQVTTPSVPQLQRRNSGTLAATTHTGPASMHANTGVHMCPIEILILCLPYFTLERMNESHSPAPFPFRTLFIQCTGLAKLQQYFFPGFPGFDFFFSSNSKKWRFAEILMKREAASTDPQPQPLHGEVAKRHNP